MLGHSHATSGALGWSAAAAALPVSVLTYPVIDVVGDHHLGTVDLLLGVFLTAGAALLPDMDHPDGTIANTLGPVSELFCTVVSWIAGGHRKATHSFFFVALAGIGTWAGMTYLGRPFTLGLVFVLLALAVRALHLCPPGKGIRAWGTVLALALGGTFAMTHWISDAPPWLPFCVALGCLVHILGDCLTDRGCPLLWPYRKRLGIEIISRTGNKVETWVLAPLFMAGTLALLWYTITQLP
ncbi:metal-dependent hydrolase [Nocardia asteroides]|uniref:metal-dependent hydrolase n=1 Tax=Nocardia asteroides TaxID=1824 RepID=UPI001E54E7CC|nr:metal-dependent hydrolase [Nocardia asteroides]UGT62075.1 metal-dependent hydrolase [Nocardia asteroides]